MLDKGGEFESHKERRKSRSRRLGNLERAYAHLMVIKRFRYYVLMFWVKRSFLCNIVSGYTF
ncbi:hypothetical protein HanXRQr2_Chr03g0131011 [Helianthus annuus]|uniref:Uncharacterized protein n=1 Tax=Helianthus annuus TaxID=4232 RepID=A0A9K3JJJ7_HELAN|nr:hypothetical protein HanXRQr2_Chr03g0131011 [Helianthus annuus]KAJ0945407.1 hypothetical protein HanPSC8_Chr03g0127801 [Helianthus annuus]